MTDNENAADTGIAELQNKIEDLEETLEQVERQNDVLENFCFGLEQEYNKAQAKLHDANELISDKNRMLEGLSSKLSKYLSPQVYNSIFSGERDVSLVTDRKKLTVFFSDLKDFTDTTDDLEPEDLSFLLNDYLTEMSAIALEYGGTVDKFIGDAIVIFFGDPETKGVKEDALACVKMAVAMQRRMVDLRARWHDRGYRRGFHKRIGINTGICNVGNFGSPSRMDYTIVGSEVNIAARMESITKPDGIILTSETYALVKDHFNAVELDPVQVKGIAREIRPYELHGILDDVGAEKSVISIENEAVKIFVDVSRLDDTGREKTAQQLDELAARLRQA